MFAYHQHLRPIGKRGTRHRRGRPSLMLAVLVSPCSGQDSNQLHLRCGSSSWWTMTSSLSVQKSLTAILMTLVACIQIIRAQEQELTSWKGGGFGLFASLDHLRFAKIHHRSKRWTEPIQRAKPIKQSYDRFLAVPSRARGVTLAKQVHQKLREKETETTWVQVKVFDMDYQTSTNTLSCSVIRSADSR